MTQQEQELQNKIGTSPLLYFARRSTIIGIFVAFGLFLIDQFSGENTALESLLTGLTFAVILTVVDYTVYSYFRRKRKEK